MSVLEHLANDADPAPARQRLTSLLPATVPDGSTLRIPVDERCDSPERVLAEVELTCRDLLLDTGSEEHE